VTVERLSRDAVEPVTDAVTRAFMADPGTLYLFRNQARRPRVLRRFLEPAVRYGLTHGQAYTTADRAGVAVWVPPPGRPAVSLEGMSRSGFFGSMLRMWPSEGFRATVLGTYMSMLDPGSYRKPHWYLWLLGVDPDRQGQGVGGALLAPILARADVEGLPCALETLTERNVRFYRGHGFEVAREGRAPLGGPYCYAMWREPRAKGETGEHA
jgi:ribosomal protein S18 acetylase RimI-like enzyme